MAKYVYPAIFSEEESGGYGIRFPDIPCCYTRDEDMSDGLLMAKDVLCLKLYDMEKDNENIPTASDIRSVKISDNEFASLIGCDIVEYKKFYEKKAVRKTLSIPSWLNEMAEERQVNFSAVLQNALKEYLDIR